MIVSSLDEVELFSNHVLIKPFELDAKIGDTAIEIDTSYRKERFANTRGEVVKVPDRLYFSKKSKLSTPWKTNQELKVGDEVFYYYLSYVNAMSKGRSRKITCNGTDYIMVPYENIYVFKREGVIQPINGYVLVRPVKPQESDFEALHKYTDHDRFTGEVAYVGSRLTDYRMSDHYKPDPDVVLNPGDRVVMDKYCDTPLQYEAMESIEGDNMFFRVQRRNIICKVNGV